MKEDFKYAINAPRNFKYAINAVMFNLRIHAFSNGKNTTISFDKLDKLCILYFSPVNLGYCHSSCQVCQHLS